MLQIWNLTVSNLTLVVFIAFLIIVFIGTCLSSNGFFSVNSILRYYLTIFQKPIRKSERLDVIRHKKHYYIKPLLFNFALPVFTGIVLGMINPINSTIITFMTTVVSIWIAILFALVALIQSLAKEKLGEDYYIVVKQAYATVMFECCISIISIVLGFTYVALCPQEGVTAQFPLAQLLSFLSVIIYSLIFILLLTMFMIFKKCNALLGQIIKANEIQKRDITLLNILRSVKQIQDSIDNKDKNGKL